MVKQNFGVGMQNTANDMKMDVFLVRVIIIK